MRRKHGQQRERDIGAPIAPKPEAQSPVVEIARSAPDSSRLTDAEADFIIERTLWALRDAVNPIDFFRGMGRGVLFGVTEESREEARELVRLFARGEAA